MGGGSAWGVTVRVCDITDRSGWRGRRLVSLAGLSLALVATGCQAEAPEASEPTPLPTVSQARLYADPGDGATAVEPDRVVAVSVGDGTLVDVRLVDTKGRPVAGKIRPDRTGWASTQRLRLASGYRLTARAVDAHGLERSLTRSFSTVKPRHTFTDSVTPLDGEAVGVGMPIAVTFDRPVQDRAAVEKALTVRPSRPVVGSWYWIDDDELHYRPRTFWPAHTDVTLRVRLAGVKGGDGLYGARDRDVRFRIGDSIVTSVDVTHHRMTVHRNGKALRTIPVTSGKPGFETRSGIKVVLGKNRHLVMDAATIGIGQGSSEYYRLDVYDAVRVTWSGEFLHAAPWSVGSQGRDNVSHGCVGMSPSNARWYFGLSKRGDVVKVVGTDKPMELQNGFGDWNVPWSRWQAGSALASP